MAFSCWKCCKPLVSSRCNNPRCSCFGQVIEFGEGNPLAQTLPFEIQSHIASFLPNRDLARLTPTDKSSYQFTKTIRALHSQREFVGQNFVKMGGRGVTIEDKYTYHHEAMIRLDKLAEGQPAAMLVFPKSGLYFLAFDASEELLGHSPLVNVVQNVLDGDSGVAKVWDKIKGCYLYLNYWPTESDLGISIQQLTARDDRLICRDWEAQVLYLMQPSKENRKGLLKAFKADPTVSNKPKAVASENGKDDPESKVCKAIKAEPKKKYVNALPRADARDFVIRSGSTRGYEKLSPTGKKLFDDIFLLAAFVLGSELFDGEKPHTVGALLVSEAGDLLSWGIDESACIHAETSTLKLLTQELRNGMREELESCRVYTSLEPCFMCAGLLAEFGATRKLAVVYGQVDPAVHEVFSAQAEGRVEAEPTPVMWHSHIESLLMEAPYDESSSTGFSTRLEGKRQELDRLHKQSLGEDKKVKETLKNKYANSVMQALGQPAYRRRFLKALFRLIDLLPRINGVTTTEEQQFLLKLWKNTLQLLQSIRKSDLDAMLQKTAGLLDASRGKHPYPQDKERQSPRTDFKAEAQRCLKLYESV
ncbi:cytidine/deoxycytidylate deaminase family protein [Corallococcus exiguus]|uniref:CMP/dCMP-type deaminase domain-containing protein n=1 Tax=Corallococcus exiguus TaxID=83462 RepID=A0A7X5BQF9_9BACT|nr:nucleoside deaminase [Corallococcus exiguus]NBC39614.1 hypothetical protein [Corallococcus exiguus]TNV60925.1 hypothetical protein FH620_22825 [Corallococcus exiguus]